MTRWTVEPVKQSTDFPFQRLGSLLIRHLIAGLSLARQYIGHHVVITAPPIINPNLADFQSVSINAQLLGRRRYATHWKIQNDVA